jgi:transcriptional regulator with XRE-family HTH domain
MAKPNPPRHLSTLRTLLYNSMDVMICRDRKGETCREIAEALGIAKSTVARWLQERRGAAMGRTLGTAKGAARLAARYDAIYRKAVRGFNRSAKDKQAKINEYSKITGPEWIEKTKRASRTETRVANPAFLARALDALKASISARPSGLRARRARPPRSLSRPKHSRTRGRTTRQTKGRTSSN